MKIKYKYSYLYYVNGNIWGQLKGNQQESKHTFEIVKEKINKYAS